MNYMRLQAAAETSGGKISQIKIELKLLAT